MKFLPTLSGRQFLLGAALLGCAAFIAVGRSTFSRAQVQNECPGYGAITEYPLRVQNSQPLGIKGGTDGYLWFTQTNSTKAVGKITTDGAITEYEPPDVFLATDMRDWWEKHSGWTWSHWGTAVDTENNYWIVGGRGVQRVAPDGTMTSFGKDVSAGRLGIAEDPDGNVWYCTRNPGVNLNGGWVENPPNDSFLVRVTPDGGETQFPMANDVSCNGVDLVGDSSGNLWFMPDRNPSFQIPHFIGIVKFLPSTGEVSKYALEGSRTGALFPGPDGDIWFLELTGELKYWDLKPGSKLSKISSEGVITDIPLSDPSIGVYHMALGPDGNMWGVDHWKNKIHRITPEGAVRSFDIPTKNSEPMSISAGPDGNMWFTEMVAGKIAKLSLGCDGTGPKEPELKKPARPDICFTLCGNGKIDVNERCDDGNTLNGDGCSASCAKENTVTCGNGIPEGVTMCGTAPCKVPGRHTDEAVAGGAASTGGTAAATGCIALPPREEWETEVNACMHTESACRNKKRWRVGARTAGMSTDGGTVVYVTWDTKLSTPEKPVADMYVWTRASGKSIKIGIPNPETHAIEYPTFFAPIDGQVYRPPVSWGTQGYPTHVSADGRYITIEVPQGSSSNSYTYDMESGKWKPYMSFPSRKGVLMTQLITDDGNKGFLALDTLAGEPPNQVEYLRSFDRISNQICPLEYLCNEPASPLHVNSYYPANYKGTACTQPMRQFMSRDGKFVARNYYKSSFHEYSNLRLEVFDTQSGELASVYKFDESANAVIYQMSDNGRYFLVGTQGMTDGYHSWGVAVWDRITNTTKKVPMPFVLRLADGSNTAGISNDGNTVLVQYFDPTPETPGTFGSEHQDFILAAYDFRTGQMKELTRYPAFSPLIDSMIGELSADGTAVTIHTYDQALDIHSLVDGTTTRIFPKDCEETECGGQATVIDPVPELPEECDDGNLKNGDGCSANCTVEDVASSSSQARSSVGNSSSSSAVSLARSSSSQALYPSAGCGDGVAEAPEQCDDGNQKNGDGCTVRCMAECEAGNQCASGRCENGLCAKTPPGAACSFTGECDAGECRNGFCSGIPPGGACTRDAECLGGSCIDNVCVAKPRAQTILPPGFGCNADTQCVSGLCLNGVCAKVPAGAACTSTSECVAGECRNGFCNVLSARAQSADGCTGNAQCASGACVNGACALLQNGSVCSSHAQCASRLCLNGFCAPARSGATQAASVTQIATSNPASGQTGPVSIAVMAAGAAAGWAWVRRRRVSSVA